MPVISKRSSVISVGSVLTRKKWQGVGEGYDRAQRADEAARRLEMELAGKQEATRRRKVAAARAEILGMGYAEYAPSDDATVERAEADVRHAKRKRWLAVHDPHTLKWIERVAQDEEEKGKIVNTLRRKRLAEHLSKGLPK